MNYSRLKSRVIDAARIIELLLLLCRCPEKEKVRVDYLQN